MWKQMQWWTTMTNNKAVYGARTMWTLTLFYTCILSFKVRHPYIAAQRESGTHTHTHTKRQIFFCLWAYTCVQGHIYFCFGELWPELTGKPPGKSFTEGHGSLSQSPNLQTCFSSLLVPLLEAPLMDFQTKESNIPLNSSHERCNDIYYTTETFKNDILQWCCSTLSPFQSVASFDSVCFKRQY